MTEIIYITISIMDTYIAYQFYKAKDGLLRKIMIAFFITKAFDYFVCSLFLLLGFSDKFLGYSLTSIPNFIAMILLILYFNKNI